jgi:CHASE3 domain sensor protein
MKKFLFKSALFLRVIFLLSLFVILLIGGFMYRHISNLTNSTKLVISTYKVNVELEHVMSYLRAAESGHRNYILTNDSLYLEPYFNAEEKVNNSIILLKQLTKANSKQQENLTILNKLSDSLFSNFSKTLDFVEIDETSIETYKNLFFEEKIIIENLRLQVNEMIDLENNLLTNRQKEYQSDLQFTPLFSY